MELSFANFDNALRKDIPVLAFCLTRQECDRLLHNTIELYDKPVGVVREIKLTECSLTVGYTFARFRAFKRNDYSWKGFRGVIMFHPELTSNCSNQSDFNMIDEMQFHTQRYLNSWPRN